MNYVVNKYILVFLIMFKNRICNYTIRAGYTGGSKPLHHYRFFDGLTAISPNPIKNVGGSQYCHVKRYTACFRAVIHIDGQQC